MVASFDQMSLNLDPKPKVSGAEKKRLSQLIRRADILALGKGAKLHHTIMQEEEHTAFETSDEVFVAFKSNGEILMRTSEFDRSKAETVDKLVRQCQSTIAQELRRKLSYDGSLLLHTITENKKLREFLRVSLQSAVSPYLKEQLGERIRVHTLGTVLEPGFAINLMAPNDFDFYATFSVPSGSNVKPIARLLAKSNEWLARLSR